MTNVRKCLWYYVHQWAKFECPQYSNTAILANNSWSSDGPPYWFCWILQCYSNQKSLFVVRQSSQSSLFSLESTLCSPVFWTLHEFSKIISVTGALAVLTFRHGTQIWRSLSTYPIPILDFSHSFRSKTNGGVHRGTDVHHFFLGASWLRSI